MVRHVAPPVVLDQREPTFIGSHPSGSSREEKPPSIVQKTMDREKVALKVVWNQRESGGSEGESLTQWEPTFRSKWGRGTFQHSQVGVMG
jgi:hypothetical protein